MNKENNKIQSNIKNLVNKMKVARFDKFTYKCSFCGREYGDKRDIDYHVENCIDRRYFENIDFWYYN